MDISLAREMIGYNPSTSLKDGLIETWNWFLDNEGEHKLKKIILNNEKNKIAFITGITGMVGSHLADYLVQNTDWDVYGLIRWRSSLDNISHLLKDINENKKIKLVYGDLRDSTSIDKAIEKARPDYFFHLAAQSFPKTSFDSSLDTMDTNIQGTNRVLEFL